LVPPSPSVSTIPDSELDRLAKDAFDKSGQYLTGVLEGTVDDYKLLEQMNDTTAQRYADIKQVATNVTKSLEDLNSKYENLRPYLDLVDDIDRSSKRLEEAAYAIDAYVKTLETKFKQLERR